MTPSQGQGYWKWYKMVEVDGAHTHGRYEKKKKLVEEFEREYSTLKFLPCKMDDQTDEHNWLHRSCYSYGLNLWMNYQPASAYQRFKVHLFLLKQCHFIFQAHFLQQSF